MTAPTWEPGIEPTPEQWAAWFVAQPADERVKIADHVIQNARIAVRCFEADHEGRLSQQPQMLAEARAEALREAARAAEGGDLIWALIRNLEERGYTQEQRGYVENAARDIFVHLLRDRADQEPRA